jgi:hypothetical protein
MAMSGSAREFSSAVLSLSLSTCAALAVITGGGCTKKEPPAASVPAQPAAPAAPAPSAPAALEAATATRAGADERPEPGTIPCKYCNVDVARRVGGTWQEAKCQPEGGANVAWPAGSAEVEVLEGNQKGLTFPVTSDPSSFAVGAELSGTLSEDAKPDTWSAAQLWITDANGKRCSSTLAIRR